LKSASSLGKESEQDKERALVDVRRDQNHDLNHNVKCHPRGIILVFGEPKSFVRIELKIFTVTHLNQGKRRLLSRNLINDYFKILAQNKTNAHRHLRSKRDKGLLPINKRYFGLLQPCPAVGEGILSTPSTRWK
jgi:hypothetical protein